MSRPVQLACAVGEAPAHLLAGYLRLPRIFGGGFSARKELDGLPALGVFLAGFA